VLAFKSYEKGREKWQGETLHGVWFDEEPPLDIYTEGKTRTNATNGHRHRHLHAAARHERRGQPVPDRRRLAADEGRMSRHVTFMTIDDAEHYTPGARAEIIASYPAHEREARAKGIPVLGSGRVFPVAEEDITCAPFPIPEHWAQINGLDFGWDHPFGATNCAWDKDADVLLRLQGVLGAGTTPLIHAAAIKPWGDWIPCAWPHDGLQHDKGSGEELAKQYAATA
jgi:hypothetical protein